ncbi:complex I NDUFA9 subunit family protein [Acidihalobacter ferrooxydans]|uniref:Epimerase n=1 Tax=Acidihalobacter ferrooxydans TaxID=1765967 RepID=A0A1P8UGE0_9GAMM|nr:complex I NDUFA9 subunit family protein [Acidihalobacter ferrooxydans]APZ42895.1 epimerase [Acidihalobacter ferrooxydans]
MHINTLCILGGTGFVGRHLAARLAGAGYRVRIPTRRRERHRELLVLPGIELLEADIHDPQALADLFVGCQAVVNLVGILNERDHDGSGFEHAHVELSRKVVDACHARGVRRLLHMSALGAESAQDTSFYLRSKAEGENLVHMRSGSQLAVTSFRPSVIFGRGDSFLNRFASLLRAVPIVFPLACPEARFQPVYVGDVVDAFARALLNPDTHGQRLNLCGPRVYTLRELVQYTARLIGADRHILGLPDWAARLQATLLEYAPGKPFSLDNYRSLQKDNVCKAGAPACPTALEAIAPTYLGPGETHRRLQRLRETGR